MGAFCTIRDRASWARWADESRGRTVYGRWEEDRPANERTRRAPVEVESDMEHHPLRRRDFLKGGIALVGIYATLKGIWWVADDPNPPPVVHDPARLKHLDPKLEAIVTAACVVMVGPAGVAAYKQRQWDPAKAMDDTLDALAPDQVGLLKVGFWLFQEWTFGFRGFTDVPREIQAMRLAAWRRSRLGVHNSIWNVLHGVAVSSFGGVQAGWDLMGYPGPCVASEGNPGRPPGQTASFTYDEAVP